jgi:hypothetical protein
MFEYNIPLECLLVGHRRVAGSNKSSHCDHRLILCAVGSIPVQLDIYKSCRCREEPKHRDNNVCSRTLTGTLIREEPKHRKGLGRSDDLRSGLGTQSRFGKRKNGLKEK